MRRHTASGIQFKIPDRPQSFPLSVDVGKCLNFQIAPNLTAKIRKRK